MKKRIILFTITILLVLNCFSIISYAEETNLDLIPDEKIIIDFGKDEEDKVIKIFNKKKELLYELEKVDETVYSTVYLNVRTRPTILSKIKTTVCPGHEFYLIGHSEFGWDIVLTGDEFYFVWNEYLTKEKPKNIDRTNISTATPKIIENSSPRLYEPSNFMSQGVIYWNSYRWTWYSEKVLPGGGLNIPGRYVDADGYICDENGYICLASNDLPKGTIVSTPFGKDGKIYDCGCASGTLDVYVSW